MAETRERIVEILSTELGVEVTSTEQPLFDSGLIDSLAFVDLVFQVEQTFSIEIDFSKIDFDAFGTVDGIAAFVDQQNRQNA